MCCGWLAEDPVLAAHTAVPCTGATKCSRGHHMGRNRHPGWQKSAGYLFKARKQYSRQRCKPTTRLQGVITKNTSKYRNSSSKDPIIGSYAKKIKNVKTSTALTSPHLLQMAHIFCKWHTSSANDTHLLQMAHIFCKWHTSL